MGAAGARVVAKSLRLLHAFTSKTPALSAADLSKRTGLSLSAVYRFLATFREHRLIELDRNGRFQPGLGVLELATVLLNRMDIRRASLRALEELQTATGATSFLTVLRGDHAVCVEKSESDAPIRVCPEIGKAQPLHAGAPRKILLAFMEPARRETLLARCRPRLTSKTPVNAAALNRQLTRIRARGYAISDGELLPGTRAVAAPVRDHQGNVVASISIAATTGQLTLARAASFVPQLVRWAGEVSTTLGYFGKPKRSNGNAPDGAKARGRTSARAGQAAPRNVRSRRMES